MSKPRAIRLPNDAVVAEPFDDNTAEFDASWPACSHTIEGNIDKLERQMRLSERKHETRFEQIEPRLPTSDDIGSLRGAQGTAKAMNRDSRKKNDEFEEEMERMRQMIENQRHCLHVGELQEAIGRI